jgi:hypothetical protein
MLHCCHMLQKDTVQNIFLGLLAGGLILLSGGMFFLYQQVQTVSQTLKQMEQAVTGIPTNEVSDLPEATDAPGRPTGRVTNYQVASKEQALITGKFTFKHVCDGEIQNAAIYNGELGIQVCIGTNKLFVVRDRREDGGELSEEEILITKNVVKPEDALFLKSVEFLPVVGAASTILIDFSVDPCMSVGDCGVCMGSGFNYKYDSVFPGQLEALRNYPQFSESGVWAAGVLAYVEGCASGAAYPVEPVMIYDPGTDKSIVVTEMKGVPAHLWDRGQVGYPNEGWSGAGDKGSPFWSDLRWNDDGMRFEINLHLIDGRIQPYFFNTKGEDVTPDFL